MNRARVRAAAARVLARMVAAVWLAAAGQLVMTGVAGAHDIGAMSVAIVREGEACAVTVTADPEHLSIASLKGSAPGAAAPGNVPARDAESELARAFAERFESAGRLVVDGRALMLGEPSSVRWVEAAGAGGEGGKAKRGMIEAKFAVRVGAGEHDVRWSSTLAVGQYLLRWPGATVEEDTNEWLDPGQVSKAMPGGVVVDGMGGGAAGETPTTRGERGGAEPAARSGGSEGSGGSRRVWAVATQYLRLGITHIVPDGLDHILFVLGLYLLSQRVRPVLMQVTAFTVAHSVTLALSMLGLVRVPASIVEPAIALSIVAVAVENVFVRELKPRRIVLVGLFGLLHGMGFAGVLGEIGLPRGQFVPALVAFNVGVEIGQLTVIGVATLAVGVWFGRKPWFRSRVAVPASVLIGVVGMVWTVQRLGG